MAMYEYTLDDNVAVLTMNNGENRLNLDSLKAFTDTLDEIENNTAANALVVTSAHEKIWSNGIDLDWLIPNVEKEGQGFRNRFRVEMFKMFKRILTYPMLTVAAINGHAFAAGAFLSFSHDFRFMRDDRGWICLPEVDLGIPLGQVFLAITRRVMPESLLEEMQYMARRLTARECVDFQIVRRACPLDQLLGEAVGFAKSLNKGREIIGQMKQETHKGRIKVIEETIAELSS